MKQILKVSVIIFFITGLYLVAFTFIEPAPREIEREPGILVNKTPEQEMLEETRTKNIDDWEITKRARFEITGRVLSINEFDDEISEISPYDFALGWGPMSDTKNLENFKVYHSDRVAYWRTRRIPLPEKEVQKHFSNTHLVTNESHFVEKMGEVRVGNIVKLKGYLVDVQRWRGWTWETSLRRDDNDCEIMWVEELRIID